MVRSVISVVVGTTLIGIDGSRRTNMHHDPHDQHGVRAEKEDLPGQNLVAEIPTRGTYPHTTATVTITVETLLAMREERIDDRRTRV